MGIGNTAITGDVAITFDYLAMHRKLLQEFCVFHLPSLATFASEKLAIFALNPGKTPSEFKHITSSATCFASLRLCPEVYATKKKLDFVALGETFARTAIDQDVNKKWISDGKAEIYCSSRGLPFVLENLSAWHPNIDKHLARISYQLRVQPNRFAIGEAAAINDADQKKKETETDTWYQPNAYHTYWTLETLRKLEARQFVAGRQENEEFRFLQDRREWMRLWARQQLGLQIALHNGKSSKLDSDQLAWALAINLSSPESYQSDISAQDVIRESLRCLFATQEENGSWRHYAPLFHYPNAGNAYCYVFETFTVLLEQALRPEAEFLRMALREHVPRLVKLWENADSTKTELVEKDGDGVRGYAWTSGHRIRPDLESWATASVFAYAQTLRRLIGVWTREEAIRGLNYKRSSRSKREAIETLDKRSRAWTRPDLPDVLASMFINPLSGEDVKGMIDPDKSLIAEDFPRSVILFGPPGTGKTTLVSGVADAIGWQYIELHPSHFVAEGLPNVQHTADGIFSKLMEVDHAVILFDEIDELVRERDIEPDQFGRFLTTSMLPRLAELWKGRKVIYFVATNHIEYFDRAVTRSERFDAVIFLSPPTFEAKRDEVLKLLKTRHSIEAEFDGGISRQTIDARMPRPACDGLKTISEEERKRRAAEPIDGKDVLSKFALVRWDELSEIALRLSVLLNDSSTVTADLLEKSLSQMKDGRVRSLGDYCRFISDPDSYERFDTSKMALWLVEEMEEVNLTTDRILPGNLESRSGQTFVAASIGTHENIQVAGYQATLCGATSQPVRLGAVRLKKTKQLDKNAAN